MGRSPASQSRRELDRSHSGLTDAHLLEAPAEGMRWRDHREMGPRPDRGHALGSATLPRSFIGQDGDAKENRHG